MNTKNWSSVTRDYPESNSKRSSDIELVYPEKIIDLTLGSYLLLLKHSIFIHGEFTSNDFYQTLWISIWVKANIEDFA